MYNNQAIVIFWRCVMDMVELLKRAKESAKVRTDEERRQILIDAKILTKEGNYNSRFFSKETVEKSKKTA